MLTEFIKAMAPILAANLLTVLFVGCLVWHGKLEHEDKDRGLKGAMLIAATLVVLFLLLGGMHSWAT
jgi:uncharacterized membrane protein (UPF0136 family)